MHLADSFRNFIAGFGVPGRDKAVSQTPYFIQLSQLDLEMMYRGDWLSRRIVDTPAFDSTRAWRLWQAKQDQIQELVKQERNFNLQMKLMDAFRKARLYGGSAIIMGINGQDFGEELNLGRVKQGDLRFLHVVERWMIAAGPLERNILSKYYGQPMYYQRTSIASAPQMAGVQPLETLMKGVGPIDGQLTIHPSRVIRMLGSDYPDVENAPDSWSDSILQTINDAIRDTSLVSSSIASMIAEAKVDIIKVPGLTQSMSTDAGTQALVKRFSGANAAKSVINALLIDSNEEWTRDALNISAGLPAIFQLYLMIACGAADIPATRVLGKSPDGQNATGESDVRNYYDRLSAEQNMKVTPVLSPLDEVLIRHTFGGRDESISYSWNPLWQMSAAEKATISLQKSQAFKVDVDCALVDPLALKKGRENQLIEDEVYPGLDQAIEEAEAARKAAGEDEFHPPHGNAGDDQDPSGNDPQADPNDEGNDDPHTADSSPQGLCVIRPLLNVDDIRSWASKQGFKSIVSDLHVTVLYSKAPVDWMKMGKDYYPQIDVPPGPPRVIEPLGVQGAVVLFFDCPEVEWRHQDFMGRGASHDYPDFQTHMTISYDPGDLDLAGVEPYDGPLVFGQEQFKKIKVDGSLPPETMTDNAFTRNVQKRSRRIKPSVRVKYPKLDSASVDPLLRKLKKVDRLSKKIAKRLDAFDPDQPRDDQGQWSGGGSGGSSGSPGGHSLSNDPNKWVASKSSGNVLADVLSSNKLKNVSKSALVFGINSLIAYSSQLNASMQEGHEEYVGHIINHFADFIGVPAAQAKNVLVNSVKSLLNHRKTAGQTADAIDPVSTSLSKVLELLSEYDGEDDDFFEDSFDPDEPRDESGKWSGGGSSGSSNGKWSSGSVETKASKAAQASNPDRHLNWMGGDEVVDLLGENEGDTPTLDEDSLPDHIKDLVSDLRSAGEDDESHAEDEPDSDSEEFAEWTADNNKSKDNVAKAAVDIHNALIDHRVKIDKMIKDYGSLLTEMKRGG